MDAIFMNPEDSKISEPYGILLNLSDKITVKKNDKYVALSSNSEYFTWTNKKKVM